MSSIVSQSIEERIKAANEDFMEAFRAADSAALSNLYTENGEILPPNSDFVTGRPAIQAFWQAIFNMGVKEARLEIVEVERCGESAIEVSRFSMLGAEGQVLDQGKYIVVWKQVRGDWKLHRDIFNSSLPAK
jgi:uncharacterized protein (TIGR02246 family)